MTDLAVAFLAFTAYVLIAGVIATAVGRFLRWCGRDDLLEGPLAEVRSLEAARRRREKTAPGTLTRPGA